MTNPLQQQAAPDSGPSRKLVSICCPVYNEQGSIPIFYERLQAAIQPMRHKFDFELIFTNNRSSDRTHEIIMGLRAADPSVQMVTLSRNFGYQASIMSGLKHAIGDATVTIDVDCEDPPEMIPVLISHWESGFDLVYGDRKHRTEFYLIHLGRLIFYRLNRLLADSEIILDMADFALFSHRLKTLMLANRSTYPFLRTEAGYVGFSRKGIVYKRQSRIHGKSHYNFAAMAQFAIGGILSSSTFPLRVAAYLFIPLVPLTIVLFLLDLEFGYQQAFRLLVAANLLFAAFCLTCLCIYLARDYKNGFARPVFIVDWKLSSLNSGRVRWITNMVKEEDL